MRKAVPIYVTYGEPEYWLTILHFSIQHMLLPGVANHLPQTFHEGLNSSSSASEADASTHADTVVIIHEDTPTSELANNQENQPPLASHLIMPPPPPTSPQPLPTTSRNRLKKLRRKRRQQRARELENRGASGVHIQSEIYRSTVNNHMNWQYSVNSTPAK